MLPLFGSVGNNWEYPNQNMRSYINVTRLAYFAPVMEWTSFMNAFSDSGSLQAEEKVIKCWRSFKLLVPGAVPEEESNFLHSQGVTLDCPEESVHLSAVFNGDEIERELGEGPDGESQELIAISAFARNYELPAEPLSFILRLIEYNQEIVSYVEDFVKIRLNSEKDFMAVYLGLDTGEDRYCASLEELLGEDQMASDKREESYLSASCNPSLPELFASLKKTRELGKYRKLYVAADGALREDERVKAGLLGQPWVVTLQESHAASRGRDEVQIAIAHSLICARADLFVSSVLSPLGQVVNHQRRLLSKPYYTSLFY